MKENKTKKYFFHPNEIALLGDTCERMEEFYFTLKNANPHVRMCYIDGSHSESKSPARDVLVIGEDHITLEIDRSLTQMQLSALLSGYDLVVINGHHFRGNRQLLFIDEKKCHSAKRREIELTDVVGVFYEKNAVLPDYFQEVFPQSNTWQVYNDFSLLITTLTASADIKPLLSMLILMGGKSTRMGERKEHIAYHGIPQWEYLKRLGENLGLEVFISKKNKDFEENSINDVINENGPIIGIYSALKAHPNRAFLVVACDMPFVSLESLEFLIKNRDCNKFATCYFNESKQWNEPLLAIWEPRVKQTLWSAIGNDFKCPKKMINTLPVCSLTPELSEWLANANDQEERKWAEQKILQSKNGY
jgi:molybdopterin-guanine dinucleotide biosynthesis protein A